jgi:hypothetical protein
MILRKVTRLDEETGQLIETQTTVIKKDKVDLFYIVFPEASKRIMFLTSTKAIQLFFIYCEYLSYEDNILDLTISENRDIEGRLNIPYAYRWKMTMKLIEVGLLYKVSPNKFEVNPKAVWKGNTAKRKDFINSKKNDYTTKFISLDALQQQTN